MSRGKQCLPLCRLSPNLDFWRDFWTWPSWVICAPAFNHKLKKICIYRGFFEIVFFKKPHKRTEKIRIGQWKGYYMVHSGSGTLQTENKIQNGRPTDEIWPNNFLMRPTTVLSLFFPCRNFCAENFVIFFYEIKLLFTLLYHHEVVSIPLGEVNRESCSVSA